MSADADAGRPDAPAPAADRGFEPGAVRRDLAPIGRRVAAEAIDVAIISAVLIGVSIIGVALLGGAAAGGDVGSYVTLSVVFGIVYAILGLGWLLLLSAWHSRGGSPGQRALGIALRRRGDGAHLSFGAALGRILVFRLAAAIVIGYFTPLFDGSGLRQGWHDKVVDALMIDLRATPAVADVAPPTFSIPAAPEPPVLVGSGILAPASSLPPALPVPPAGAAQDGSSGPPLPPLPFPPASVVAAGGTPIPDGLVSEVPGVVRAPRPAEQPAPAPAPAAPATDALAPVAAPVDPPVSEPPASASDSVARPAPAAPFDDGDVDATRHVAPRRAAGVVVVWDDGVANTVTSSAVFGRNPESLDGSEVYAVPDATRSLSKTHFDLVVDADGVWITDRHSTNGTSIASADGRRAAPSGERVRVNLGDTVLIGDRSFTLRESA